MNNYNYPNLAKLFFSLNTLLRQLIKHDIELLRIARTAALMLQGGLSPNSVPPEIMNRVVSEQRPDGGWVGPDDTMWILLFLKLMGKSDTTTYASGLEYLCHNRQENCWGRSSRDIPRIPVTGRILYFLPELNTSENLEHLLALWQKEKNSLTYKAAYTIMACRKFGYSYDEEIVRSAITWLKNQQNDDGGFGPWKNHPAGSDVFCTSVVVLGLAQYAFSDDLVAFIKRSLTWMQSTQIPNGLWPYHQIEDGASWGFFTLNFVKGLNLE